MKEKTIKSYVKIFKKVELFADIDDAFLNIAARLIQPVNFPQNATIIEQAEQGRGLFILMNGIVKVQIKLFADSEIQLCELSSNDIFGEMSIMSFEKSAANVVAATDIKCLFLKKEHFEMLHTIFPEHVFLIKNRLAEQVHERINLALDRISSELTHLLPSYKSDGSMYVHDISQCRLSNSFELTPKLNAITHLKFFKNLSYEEFECFFDNAKFYSCPKDMVIHSEFNNEFCWYIVIEGAIQQAYQHQDTIAKLKVMHPGDAFCALEYYQQKNSILSPITRSKAIIIRITKQDMDTFKKENCLLWFKCYDLIFATLSKKLGHLNTYMLWAKIELMN